MRKRRSCLHPAAAFSCPPLHAGGPILCRQPDRRGRRAAYSAQIPAEPPAGESPVTGGSGALRIAGAASWSAQRKMHDMVFRLHRKSGPQGGVGRDVAGHSFRTGKPCCHPSRTQAPCGAAPDPTSAGAPGWYGKSESYKEGFKVSKADHYGGSSWS